MSVLACDRKKCDNVMCDRYNPEYGYICDECFEELEKLDGVVSIIEFMSTPRDDYTQKIDEPWDNYVDRVFTHRNEY